MKIPSAARPTPGVVAACFVFVALRASLPGADGPDAPGGSGKPGAAVGPVPEALRETFGLSPFYSKHAGAGGLPVVSSEKVADHALLEAAYLVDRLLEHRPDVRRAMIERKARVAVMAVDEFTTDIPEHSHMRPKDYADRRARGMGGPLCVSAGEENLLGYEGDPYAAENILIHEFAHGIHHMGLRAADPSFDRRLREVYRAAMDAGLWKDKYAATNPGEYWAEGVQSWFDTNRENDGSHNHVDTREELEEYDPALAKLLAEVFGDGPWRYRKPSERSELAHLEGFDRSAAPRFAWPERLRDIDLGRPSRDPRRERRRRGEGSERESPAAGERTSSPRGDAEGEAPAPSEPFPVAIRVDAAAEKGELRPIWRFFGADEPNYAYMPNGRKLIGELGELAPKRVYFRAHNLLTSGDGTPGLKWGSTGVYREDADGEPIYDWTIVDRIFDTYIEHGVRPYVEIGFMPQDLSVRPEPYRHSWRPGAEYGEIYTGWAYPPKDLRKWAELVFQWTKHCVERYGREEVETWYWQTWNEPNIGYWQGTREEFLALNDHGIDAVRRALPAAKVGGADTAGSGGRYTRAFIEHCLRGTNHATGETGTPLDFVSFHAKGAPRHVDGHVRMGIANQLRTIDEGFRIIASYPELAGKPVVIGESDPEGCAACQGEHLAYRNGTMYSSYTAASFARKHDLAERHGVNFEGALTWAFEFEDQPYFAGFRALATNGIDKPVLNVFRMFGKMSGRRLAVESDGAVSLREILRRGVRDEPDVSALASLDRGKLCVLAWHYHDDDVPGPAADVKVVLAGLPPGAAGGRLRHFRIDETHSNAFAEWKRMGSPQEPSAEEYARLEAAGRLAEVDEAPVLRVEGDEATVTFSLPRQAVSLIVLEWEEPEGE